MISVLVETWLQGEGLARFNSKKIFKNGNKSKRKKMISSKKNWKNMKRINLKFMHKLTS